MTRQATDSYPEVLQKHAAEFVDETGVERFTVKDLGVWAIRSGRWEAPADLVLKKCCEDYARALREQHFTDQYGQQVRANHVARVIRGDQQLHLWADIRRASHKHIKVSFGQRRKQIVGECRQLNRDNKFYQTIHPDRAKIQIIFDFRDDIEEGEFSGEYPDKKPA